MGIRMHLAVGYGLDLNIFGDLRADHSQLSYDEDGAMENKKRFAEFKADFLRWCEEVGNEGLMDKMIFHENCDPPKQLYQMVSYDSEFGFEDKVLLTPSMSRKNWSRYGDLLDAFLYEAQDTDIDYIPQWIEKPGTLYPYVGLMRANPDMPLGVEKYWESCYLDDPKHKDAIAWAPWHLWFVIKHLRLWPEDKTTEAFLSLRPTIYRCWS